MKNGFEHRGGSHNTSGLIVHYSTPTVMMVYNLRTRKKKNTKTVVLLFINCATWEDMDITWGYLGLLNMPLSSLTRVTPRKSCRPLNKAGQTSEDLGLIRDERWWEDVAQYAGHVSFVMCLVLV